MSLNLPPEVRSRSYRGATSVSLSSLSILDASSSPYCFGTVLNSLMTLTYNSTWTKTTYASTTVSSAGSTSTNYAFSNTTTVTERAETVFVYTGVLAAKPVIVAFKENEISTGVLAASTTSPSPAPFEPTASVASSPTSEQGGLPSGAKAGIGVGVVLGVCALVSLGFVLYRSRKRKITRGGSTPGWGTPELSNKPVEVKELSNDAMRTLELPGSPGPELDEHHTNTGYGR